LSTDRTLKVFIDIDNRDSSEFAIKYNSIPAIG